MAVSDFLSKIGHGVEEGLGVAGRALAPVGKAIIEEEAGYAPAIAAEKRQRAERMDDAAIEVRAKEIENQIALGDRYGTLTPDQRQQYLTELGQLYSHPKHAGKLMDRLRGLVHPTGAVATRASAVPKGGIAGAEEANAEKLAEARYAATRANNPKLVALDTFTQDKFGTDFNSSTPEQQEEALGAFAGAGRAPKYTSHIVADPESPTGFSYGTWDVNKNIMVSKMPGITPPRGFYPTQRVSKSTDQFGNVTETVSEITPQIPGVTQGAAPGATPSSTPQPVTPHRIGGIIGGVPRVATPPGGARPAVGPKSLDASGHIPPGAGNEQVRQLANQLIDGMDLKEIPQKAKAAAAELASRYGWFQGSFTPKEKILINEATAKIQQLRDSPALKVLDSPTQRGLIAQVLAGSQAKGVAGFLERPFTIASSMGLSKDSQQFIRELQAAIGVTSGLAPITRGGRSSEASIGRLINELPNVLQSTSAEDARLRLDQLLQEVKVAQTTKGTTPVGGAGAALGGPQPVDIIRDPNGNIIGVR